jgi:hypothetical protein
MANIKFDLAKKNKADEFYTQLNDIEKELIHYKDYFLNKVVFLNCDDPFESNFFKYFALNFNHLKLKKLIAISYVGSPVLFQEYKPTNYSDKKKAYKIEINKVSDINKDGTIDLNDIKNLIGENGNSQVELKGDGDFRSEESIKALIESDVVVTNPPFSLFREYVEQLFKYNKKFLIIGNQNAITYKEIFPLIKENKLWLGISMNGSNRYFQVPDDYPLTEKTGKIENGKKYAFVKAVVWFTNIKNKKWTSEIVLFKKYKPAEYPKYENYDAINVDNVNDIPMDYFDSIGVPITFLHKYNPNQFEIIALGIVGSINFTSERKMEILKNGHPTGKFTINAKGTLYKKYDSNYDKVPIFKDVQSGQLYTSIYARIIIIRKNLN